MNLEECLNVEKCTVYSKKNKERNERFQDRNDDLLEVIVDKLSNEEEYFALDYSTHAKQRSFERLISEDEVESVIMNGWSIDSQKDSLYTTITVLSHVKRKKNYIPVHVVIAIDKTKSHAKVITAYYPKSQPWKWNEDYDQRICYCK